MANSKTPDQIALQQAYSSAGKKSQEVMLAHFRAQVDETFPWTRIPNRLAAHDERSRDPAPNADQEGVARLAYIHDDPKHLTSIRNAASPGRCAAQGGTDA